MLYEIPLVLCGSNQSFTVLRPLIHNTHRCNHIFKIKSWRYSTGFVNTVCVCVYIYIYIYIRGVNINALTHVINQKILKR